MAALGFLPKKNVGGGPGLAQVKGPGAQAQPKLKVRAPAP
jgi:hypothetical protein